MSFKAGGRFIVVGSFDSVRLTPHCVQDDSRRRATTVDGARSADLFCVDGGWLLIIGREQSDLARDCFAHWNGFSRAHLSSLSQPELPGVVGVLHGQRVRGASRAR